MPNDYKHLLDAPKAALDRMAGQVGPAGTWDDAHARSVGPAGAPSSAVAEADPSRTTKPLAGTGSAQPGATP